jgi:hypothetical protein
MGFFETFTLALAASSVGLVAADGLNARAKVLGKYMGTEYNVGELSESTFMNIANNLEEFGSAVPGNEQKVRISSCTACRKRQEITDSSAVGRN